MLAELKIENVAVIEKAEVQFTPGLNVLTGETGAGKSIMIDSINAILGNRTSRDLVRSGAPKARIWATFESIPAHVREQVEKCGYGAQDDLLLYREISADGKGSCRIVYMLATAACGAGYFRRAADHPWPARQHQPGPTRQPIWPCRISTRRMGQSMPLTMRCTALLSRQSARWMR